MDHCINRSSSWNDGPMQLSPNHLADDDNNSNNDDNVEEYALSILSKNPRLIRVADSVGDNILHMFARKGDSDKVCKLIEFLEKHGNKELKKATLMDKNGDGDTALHVAIKNGHRKLAYHLVKAENEAATVYNKDWLTPYSLAMEAGYSEVVSVMPSPVEFLLSLHVDVEMQLNKRVLRPVRRSIDTTINEEGKDVTKTELLRNGKKLLWRQNKQTGQTILHAAVESADGGRQLKELVEFMIDNGLTDAAVLGDRYGDTALHLAVQFGYVTKARYLIKAAPRTVYQVNYEGVSPLYLAIKNGYLKGLVMYMFRMLRKGLLPACASEILQHPKNATVAHLAIKLKDIGTLKQLMEHLPELVKATDEKGWRPLSYAASKGYLDGVNYLLSKFLESVQIHDKDGYLPLHKAVGRGHVSIVEAFLKHCPQTLHCVDRKGRSILHIAVIYDRAEIITYLTEKVMLNDSFLNLRDNDGKTFEDYTKELKRFLSRKTVISAMDCLYLHNLQ